MVAKVLEVQATTGQSGLTATAYPIGTDAAATECNAAALTEATNRLGWYTCSCNDLAAGDYQVKVLTSGGTHVASWLVTIEAAAGTYTAQESLTTIGATLAAVIADAVCDEGLGGHVTAGTLAWAISHMLNLDSGVIANAGDAAEQYDSTIDSVNFRALFSGLTVDGDRGGVTFSNPA